MKHNSCAVLRRLLKKDMGRRKKTGQKVRFDWFCITVITDPEKEIQKNKIEKLKKQ